MSFEKYIVIKRGAESVLYRRAEDGPEFQTAARSGDHDGLVEIASMLNRVEEIESSITELATVSEDKPMLVAQHPAEVKLEHIGLTINDFEKGYVGPGKTLRIIKSILEGKVIQ